MHAYLERKYNFEGDLMKVLPTILWEMPIDYVGTDQLAVYDIEDHIIHLNSWQYEILMDSKLLFFRIIIHELLHHVFSPISRRGKINLDSKRWRFFNFKWNCKKRKNRYKRW